MERLTSIAHPKRRFFNHYFTRLEFDTKTYRVFLLLLVIGFAAYFPGITTGYISDDFGFVEDVELHGFSAITYNFGDKFFIPISHLLGIFFYKIFFGSALLQHALQIMLHAYIGYLIFCFLEKYKLPNWTLSMSVFAGVFFVVHPFQAEAVIWLSSKSYIYFGVVFLWILNYVFSTKKPYLFQTLLLLFIAIHIKEMGYLIPFFIYGLSLLLKVKIPLKHYLWMGVISITSLLIRFMVLGELIGGYGSEKHLPENLWTGLLKGISAYALKIGGIIRWDGIRIWSFVATVVGVSLILMFLKKWKTISLRNILIVLALILTCLIPFLTLELSFLRGAQTDRYSYWAWIPVSVAISWSLHLIENILKPTLIALFLVGFTFLSVRSSIHWQESGALAEIFLKDLNPHIEEGDEILLLNIPDTYRKVYCLRNGIEDYFRTQGKKCNIEIWKRQNFEDFNGGLEPESYMPYNAQDLRFTYPIHQTKDIYQPTWEYLFDKVFYYYKGKFHSIK